MSRSYWLPGQVNDRGNTLSLAEQDCVQTRIWAVRCCESQIPDAGCEVRRFSRDLSFHCTEMNKSVDLEARVESVFTHYSGCN
jgi:hypothetical protein